MQKYKSAYKPRSLRRLEKRSKRNIVISLVIMFGLFYLLVSWGLPALIGSLSFLNRFKPIMKIESASKQVVIAPPVLNIPFEATNSAGIIISGYSTPKYKVEIYFNDDLKNTVEVQDDGRFQTETILLSSGINNIYGKTIDPSANKSLSSKTIKLIYSNEKPKLEITEPTDGQRIQGGDKKIRVSGKTDVDNSVTINDVTVIINTDGNFSKEVNLNEGENTITILTTSLVGNVTKIERKVFYSP